jgi:hypothetical protein
MTSGFDAAPLAVIHGVGLVWSGTALYDVSVTEYVVRGVATDTEGAVKAGVEDSVAVPGSNPRDVIAGS